MTLAEHEHVVEALAADAAEEALADRVGAWSPHGGPKDAGPAVTLRRSQERNASSGSDGGTEAPVDGITVRKLGSLWRVWLDSRPRPRSSDAVHSGGVDPT
jgi:hypothetical protein